MSVIWEVHEDSDEVEGVDEFGKPDPAYAAALGLIPAPIGRRIAASVIDWTIYLLVQLPLLIGSSGLLLLWLQGQVSNYGLVQNPSFVLTVVCASVTVGLSLVFCIVQVVLHGVKGMTVGKSLMGLRSVNVKTLEKPRVGRAFVRGLVFAVSQGIPFLPLLLVLSSLWDREKRGRSWLDAIGALWMVDIRKGLNPYDSKRMRIARKSVKADPVERQRQMPSLATPVGSDEEQVYRPGARVSAGVLGVSRPRSEDAPSTVGLTGPATGSIPSAAPGQPALGIYREPSAPAPAQPSTPYRPGSLTGAPTPPPVQQAPDQTVHAVPGAAPTETQVFAATQVPGPQSSYSAPQPQLPIAPPHPTAVPPTVAPAVPPVAAAEAYRAVPKAPQYSVPADSPAFPTQQPAPTSPGSAPGSFTVSADTVYEAPLEAAAESDWDESLEATRVRAPRDATPAGFTLVLDVGDRVPLNGIVLVGRNPVASDGEQAALIPVNDSTRSISKTHFAIRAVGTELMVQDRHSTNGTTVVRGAQELPVVPGSTVVVHVGDTIRFGDRTAAVVSA